MENELIEFYIEWYKALVHEGKFYKEGKESITNVNDFSHPYFCGVPKEWSESQIRVMICGREGNGEITKDDNANPWPFPDIKDDDKIKEFIKEVQKNMLGYVDGTRERGSFKSDNHAFAKTFRKFQDALENVPIIWNECDKICHTDYKGYKDTNALTSGENTSLHHVRMNNEEKDILEEEIKILKPTHIVFLGYWRQSLGFKDKKEVFPKDKTWDDGQQHLMNNGANVYYFSHPQFKGSEYQNAIDKAIKDIGESNILKVNDMKDY